MQKRRARNYGSHTDASTTREQAEPIAEAIRENLAKGWGTPAQAYFFWDLSPEIIQAVREILHQRGIWRRNIYPNRYIEYERAAA